MPRIVRKNGHHYKNTNNYQSAKAALRRDFQKRCAYCMLYHAEFLEFQIDHFYPQKRGGSNNYTNLYLVCVFCNRYKRDHFPAHLTESDLDHVVTLPPQMRFADPCREEDFGHHFVEDTAGELVACTAVGEYHIEHLSLNRPDLVAHRRRRHEYQKRLSELKQQQERLKTIHPKTEYLREYKQIVHERIQEITKTLETMIPYINCSRPERGLNTPATCHGSCNP